MVRMIPAILILGLAAELLAGCGDSDNGRNPEIVIGGVWAEDVDQLTHLEVLAAQMAIEEINASGVFDRPVRLATRSPARGDLIDPDKAAEAVRELYDQEHAVGFVSGHGYETVYRMIEVTNSEPYSDFVQCSATAQDPGANTPGMSGWDANDTFYRTVVSYEAYLDLGIVLGLEEQWFQIGLIRFDNPSGDEVSLGVRLKIGEHSDQGFTLAYDQSIPNQVFDVEADHEELNAIVDMSLANKVDVSILAVLQAQSVGITKYLIDHGYHGGFLQTFGSESSDLFHIADGLADWLGGRNYLIGVEPDGYQGKNSEAFLQKFVDAYDQQPSSASSTAYDCVYALAYSLLYAGPNDYSAAEIKANMPKFKESNRTDDEDEVGLGADEFARAAELIRQGKRIDFQGASGRLLFDDNGDRPSQGLRVFGPNQSVTGWEVKQRYDADLNKIP